MSEVDLSMIEGLSAPSSASPRRLLSGARLMPLTAADDDRVIDDGALLIEGEQLLWIGARTQLPPAAAALPAQDLGGALVTPALIDCHTHLVHGGHRAHEFALRLRGASYAEIAAAGGGIASTVRATRSASDEALLASALPRLDALLAEGVGVVEIKSGYGLDLPTELRLLRLATRLGELRPVRIRRSFLGAHAVPEEYRGRSDDYLDHCVIPALRAAQAQGLVDAVDAFCETIAFSPAQVDRLFAVAHALGLPVKLHAEQLSDLGGARLAAAHRALSADHLEHLDEAGVAAMAAAGTVAVLLPGAYYFLREHRRPPVAQLRAAGVPMALSTDCNPGTSPLSSLLLTMNLGCVLFGLSPQEALAAVTVNAARALGLTDCGSLAPGQRADLAVWNIRDPAELSYRMGFNPLIQRYFGGRPCPSN